MEDKEKYEYKTDHIKHEAAETTEEKQEGKHREQWRWKQHTAETKIQKEEMNPKTEIIKK